METPNFGRGNEPSPSRAEPDDSVRRDAAIGLWDWDLLTDSVFYSPEWKRLLGYQDAEISNSPEEWRSRVHPDDLPGALEQVRNCTEGGAGEYRVEFRMKHKDGSYRQILAQGTLIGNPGGKPIRLVGAHIDLTQQHLAERTLRESEELHRLTLDSMSDAILIADDEGHLTYICPNVRKIFGFTTEEVRDLGRIDRLLGPDLFDPASLEESGELPNIEREVSAKSGDNRTLLVSVKRVSIRGGTVLYTCRDISDRKKTENIFRSLVTGTGTVGVDFFHSLVRELAAALGVRSAFVAEALPGTPERVRTLAVWSNGRPDENFEYALAGTPCESVMRQSLCFYTRGVQQSFPADDLLRWEAAESYLGTPLFGSAGQILGILAVMHDEALPSSELPRSLLTVFAARAGAELERLRAERAWRRSEEFFRAIVQDQTEMIVRWKPDGTCTFVNDAFCRATGKTPEQLIGCRCFAELPDEHECSLQRRVASLRASHPVASHIFEIPADEGEPLCQEWTDHGLFDSSGRLVEIQSTGRDITERRNAENRIRQLNRVYAVLSNINETIVREGDTDRLFDSACRIAVEKGGFRMAWIGLVEPATRGLRVCAHAGASADTVEIVKQIVDAPEGGCAFTAEAIRTGQHAVCNNIAADPRAASWRAAALQRGYRSMASLPLVVDAAVAGTFNIYAAVPGFFDAQELQLLDELALDIAFSMQVRRREAERRAAEAARAESEERFRQLTESIQDVFWMTDPEKRRVLYVSRAYESIWGRSCQSLYDAPASWMDSIHPDDRQRVSSGTDAIPSHKDYDAEYRIVRSNGQVRWIRDRAFPVRDASGAVTHIVGVARDVTERRDLEEQVRQSQKMEAIGQLAGGVAHDFNNILAAILMQAELAAMGPGVPEDARAGLNHIRVYAERAANLTRQLLLFSRRQVLQTRELDLNDIVTSLAKMLQRIIGEDIHLQLHLHPASLFIRADAGMIDQVIMNLAVNARDAMPRGGRLLIETAQKTVDAEFARLHADAVPGTYAWLAVSDSGAGIPPDILPRIFEPFYTTKEPGKGTGLGLATVYGILKQHQGWIQVDSEPGQGATFQVFLPLVKKPSEAISSTAPRSKPGAAPKRSSWLRMSNPSAFSCAPFWSAMAIGCWKRAMARKPPASGFRTAARCPCSSPIWSCRAP